MQVAEKGARREKARTWTSRCLSVCESLPCQVNETEQRARRLLIFWQFVTPTAGAWSDHNEWCQERLERIDRSDDPRRQAVEQVKIT